MKCFKMRLKKKETEKVLASIFRYKNVDLMAVLNVQNLDLLLRSM